MMYMRNWVSSTAAQWYATPVNIGGTFSPDTHTLPRGMNTCC
jgi:hypothetical protein